MRSNVKVIAGDLVAFENHRTIRVAVINGMAVPVKRCRECGVEKRVSLDRRATGFTLDRRPNGTFTFKPRCKPCNRIYNTSIAIEAPSRTRQARLARSARRSADPELAAIDREQNRDRCRRWRETHDRSESDLQRQRRLKRQRTYMARVAVEDPDFWSVVKREERRRAAADAAVRPTGRSMETVLAGPFRAWLIGYSINRRLWREVRDARSTPVHMEVNGAAVSDELCLVAKRVTSVLAGAQPTIAVELVDRAIQNAMALVTVNGVEVWSIYDLYDLSDTLAA